MLLVNINKSLIYKIKNCNCYILGIIIILKYDRIGGDAFESGVIHWLINQPDDLEYSLKFGLATSILAHTLYGDVSTLLVNEVEEFIKTSGNASIQR